MEIAPARQPRVSPAVPRWSGPSRTAALLVGAGLIAGVVMLPPFAAGYLFPSRTVAPPSGAHRTAAKPPRPARPAPAMAGSTVTETPGATNAMAPDTRDKRDGTVETTYSDLPIAAEPAKEPPRPAPSPAASATPAASTLATGVFASRPAPETGSAAEPPTELTAPPIPPLNVLAAPAEPAPATSPPPLPREPLPLQTDLLSLEAPGVQSTTNPGPAPSGGTLPGDKSGPAERATDRAADRHG